MLKKISSLFVIMVALVVMTGCSVGPTFDEVNNNLSVNGLDVATLTKQEILDALEDQTQSVPEAIIPENVLIAGAFGEEINLDKVLNGEVKISVEELEGGVFDFGTSLKATAAYALKDDVMNYFKDMFGITDEDISKYSVECEGSLIYIGTQEFVSKTKVAE